MGKAVSRDSVKAIRPPVPDGMGKYLNHYRKSAIKARDKMRAALADDKSGWASATFRYWDNVARGLAWVIGQSKGKQKGRLRKAG